jgi:hypothetical protein
MSAKKPGKVVGARIRLLGISSKEAHEAAKAARRPFMEVHAGNRTRDNTFEFGGMAFRDDAGTPVTGTIPAAWADFFRSHKAKPGRPRNSAATQIAMYLTMRYFLKHCGKIRESRIRAADLIMPGTEEDAAERRYRRAEKALFSRGELKDYDRIGIVNDRWIMVAHKTAIIETQADGTRLSGMFWMVVKGEKKAVQIKQEYFFAPPGSNRKSGGTIIAAE